jgi:hypothetical protein
MELWDFDGCHHVDTEDQLLTALRSVRRGAFILSHGGVESLWVSINGDAAHLWFLPEGDGRNPGFVPNGMWPGQRRDVRFLQTSGDEGDSIFVLWWWQLVPFEVAYTAAVEYLHTRARPSSVTRRSVRADPLGIAAANPAR